MEQNDTLYPVSTVYEAELASECPIRTHRVGPGVQEHDEVLGRGVAVLDLALVAVPVHSQPRLVQTATAAREVGGAVSLRRGSCG